MYKRLSEIKMEENINNRVFIVFMAKDVEVRFQKDGVTKYISMNMYDKGVCIDVKLFGAKESQIEMIENGGVYNAAVDVKTYDKSPSGYSCILYNIDRNNEIQSKEFVDWTPNVDESYVTLQTYISEIYDTNYGRIAYNILNRNWAKFSKWTAAKSMHHEKLGGLLVHTTEVIVMADSLADVLNGIYGEDFINKSLLISAIILHDVCKTVEFEVDTNSGSVTYADDSSLSSHIMEALREVDIEAYEMGLGMPSIEGEDEEKTKEQIALEKEEIKLLKHCIASHHGKLEYGSPVVPSIPEAVLIHAMDNLSAEMYRFNQIYSLIKPGKSHTAWSNGGMKSYYKETTR